MKTPLQIFKKHGVHYYENDEQSIIAAMDEYAEQQCDLVQDLFTRPLNELKPLEDLYRKDNPRPDNRFYSPDMTKFCKWIAFNFKR